MDITDYKLPGDKKSRKKKKPTLRFELRLPDSTDTSCPEYSYIELVRENLKDRESKGQNDALCQNLLEEEEEKERNEAKAIAEYYEIKYGVTGAGQNRKRKDKGRDLVGAGYGYDENDPFVDDSEAYDEIVPASLTTEHGGFYINTGKLNFKALPDESDTGGTSSDDSVPLSHHIMKKKKKRANLLDSDESGNEFQNDEMAKKKKKKLKPPKDPEKKRRKMSLNGKDKVAGLKQRPKKIKKPTSLAQKLVAKAKAQQMMNASSAANSAHTNNGAVPQFKKSLSDESFKSKPGELGHLENKDLAQVAKQLTKELMSVGSSKINPDTGQKIENGLPGAITSSAKNTPVVNHELPPNLPQKLGDKIESLKKIAKSTEDAGKMKFFSSDVNKILLDIEESAQGLRNKERQGMYLHIAQHLPCSKDTLLKRVKKLQEDNSDQQLKGPIDRLKAAVDAVMTSQIEAYVLECDAKSEKFPDKSLAAASTDEDDEGEEKSTDTSSEKGKRTYAPRRKFKWDDNLRNLLCDVVSIKMKFYERFKGREKQSAEDYLKAYLESTIKPLWPKPWMQTRILFKESRSAHEHLTNNCQKQKKAGSSKKVLSVGKETATPRLDATPSSVGQSESKISKKQLSFDNHTSKNSQSGFKPKINLSVDGSNMKRSSNGGMIDLSTSGGFELTAAIEGDDLIPPPKAANFSVARTTPKDEVGAWKAVGSSVSNLSKSGVKAKSSPSASTPGTSKIDRKTESKASKPSSKVPDSSPKMDSKAVQDYASDFVKMMMSHGHLSQGSSGYLGMPGLTNYETISKILGLKPEDVMPKAAAASKPPLTDEKFQFKISSNATVAPSKTDSRSAPAAGFQIVDPSRKRLPTTIDSAWTSKNIGPLKIPSDKVHSVAQNSAARSASSYSDVIKKSTTQNSSHMQAKFAMPSPDNSKFIPQRQRKNVEAVNPEQSNLEAAAKILKLASSPSGMKKHKQSPPTALPLARQHHQFGPLPKSPIPPIDPSHGGLSPMVLSSIQSPYSASGLGSSFSSAFTSPLASAYSSASKFQPPISPGRSYPSGSVPGHPFSSPSFSSYPQVKISDLQGNKELMKHVNLNLQGNQTR